MSATLIGYFWRDEKFDMNCLLLGRMATPHLQEVGLNIVLRIIHCVVNWSDGSRDESYQVTALALPCPDDYRAAKSNLFFPRNYLLVPYCDEKYTKHFLERKKFYRLTPCSKTPIESCTPSGKTCNT